jgi:DNA (cytosine-5)-methyltransferase 1
MRVAMNKWPTPKCSNANGAGIHGDGGMDLQTAVKTWPTPVQSDYKGSGPVGTKSQASMLAYGHLAATAATGQLNPDWVEALMDWPQGWTRTKPLAADVWQHWLHANRWQDWEPDIPRVIVGAKDRVNRLKAIGNGQVPACVAEIGAELMNLFAGGHSESHHGRV